MKRSDNKGVILGLVLIIMLLLTLLGYGLLSLSNVNAIETVKVLESNQAFWLAEAGVTKAIENLPSTSTIPGSLGNGTYSVTIELDPDEVQPGEFIDRWNIESAGTVHAKTRRIRVRVGAGSGLIKTVIRSANGPVETDLGNPTINGPVEEYSFFTYESIFGMTGPELYSKATHEYSDLPNNPDPLLYPIEGITWVNMSPGKTLGFTSTGWSGSGLLVVNGDVSLKGGDFSGILWVNGDLTVSAGNVEFKGSIFVSGTADVETKVTGTPIISYDAAAIDLIFNDLNCSENYPMGIISWKEIT